MYSEERYQQLKAAFSFGGTFKGSKKQRKAAEKEFHKLQEIRSSWLSLKRDIEEAEWAIRYLSRTFEEHISAFGWERESLEWCKKTHKENLGYLQRGVKFLAESAGVEVSTDNLLEAYKSILVALQAKISQI